MLQESRSGSKKTDWRIVTIVTLAGVVAAMQLGKVPPAIPALSADLGVGMVTAGWVVSVFSLMAATLAIAVGIFADRMAIAKVIAAGITLLLLGAIAGGYAQGGLSLIAARALAGLGLVSIAVAAPRMIVGATHPRDHGLALGFWSIYMPAGIALGMLLTPLLLTMFDWRGVWFANGLLLLAFLTLFLLAIRSLALNDPPPKRGGGWNNLLHDLRKVTHVPGPWLLAAIFACYTIPYFAMMTWFPLFLIETQGKDVTTAAAFGALVVAANIIGNLGGAWLLHRGGRRWWLQLIAFVVMGFCAVGIFSPLLGAEWKIPLAFLFSTVGGLLPAAILAASAVHSPALGQVATVNGVIVQGANCGSLSGPPLMAAVVAVSGGWLGAWWLTLVCVGVGILLVLKLRAVEARFS
ncbi:MAG: MFS transporter [Sedimenticola sp.]